METPGRFVVSPPPSVKSPPPSYPESMQNSLDETAYGDSDASSINTVQDRRFSISSMASEMVLPRDMYPNRHRDRSASSSGESSYTFGKPDVYGSGYADPVTMTPPSSAMAMLSMGQFEDGRRSTLSYFPVDEADDPAVQRSIRAYPSPPPSGYAPSLQSQRSQYVQPLLRSSSQQSPTFTVPRSPTLVGAQSPNRSPQSMYPSPTSRLGSTSMTLNPCVCTFRMSTNGSMVLAPPENSTDLAPLYRIDVLPNCFTPTSYITKVSRGNMMYLGEFEMGISKDEPRLFMGQQWYQMKEVFNKFRKVNSRLGDRWVWQHGNHKLHWDCRTEAEIACYSEEDEKKIIAVFRPAAAQPTGSFINAPATTLEILTPVEQSLLDEILMSVLIVERRRSSPRAGNDKDKLFN